MTSAELLSWLERSGGADHLLRHLEQVSDIGTWLWTPATGLRVSDRGVQIAGFDSWSEDRAHHVRDFLAVVHPADRMLADRAIQAIDSPAGFGFDHRVVRSDGAIRVVHTTGRPVFAEDGSLQMVIGSVQDVSEIRRNTRDLANARDLFSGVLGAATEQAIVGLDLNGAVTIFNSGAERMLGYSAAEMIGVEDRPALHDKDEIVARAAALGVEPGFQVVVGAAANGDIERGQWTYLTKDGRRLQVMITATALHGQDGAVVGYLEVATDITARVTAERALQASEIRFQEIFEHASSGIVLVDPNGPPGGVILQVNPALCRISGYTAEDLLGSSITRLLRPEDHEVYRQMTEPLRSGQSQLTHLERQWIHADGREIWVQISVTPVPRDGGNLLMGIVEDITDRKAAEGQLSHLALHDSLTGLPNRMLLLDRLNRALHTGTDQCLALLYLDVDGFKSVNDGAGHSAGDEVLLEIATRILNNVRPHDTVARIGGDEFVVLCPNVGVIRNAEGLATRLLAKLAEPYRVGTEDWPLSVSIGIAILTPSSTAASLLREADASMYEAKRLGKNRFHRR